MKFIVSSESLLRELQILGGIINNNNTLPILDNFLFHLNGNQLILTASDLETSMSATIEVESQDNTVTSLPARLLDTLKTFPEQPLHLSKPMKIQSKLVPTTVNMLWHTLTVRISKGSSSKRSY